MSCYSSNFLDEWALDFGSTPPLYYSEYGDVDADGLPNWFEMMYGGHFPYMDTASSVIPSADPDADGFTNLQEYQNRTDPEKMDVSYPVGYIWDMSHIQARGLSFNPDQDTYRKNVWFYLFRHGMEQAIPHDGNYRYTTSIGNVPYAGLMAHLSPNFDPDGLTYNTPDIFHRWIARRQSGSTWQTVLRPRDNAAVILGWRSPVNGVVSLSFNVAEVIGLSTPLVIDIGRNQESTQLASVSVLPGQTGSLAPLSITVQKGDFIYLFSHGWGTYGASYGYLENIKFTLLQNNGG